MTIVGRAASVADRESAPATRRARFSLRRLDLVGLSAVFLMALFLSPGLRAGVRADDTWTSEESGHLKLNNDSLIQHLWESAENFWRSGRPNVLGTSQGLSFSWLLNNHTTTYHVVLITLTLIAAAVLYAFIRELDLPRSVGLLILVLLAGAVQFRSFHDPMLGYWGTTQIMLALTLGSLLYFVRSLRGGGRRALIVSLLLFLPCPLLYEGAYPLVALHLGVALFERRGWAAWRASAAFLVTGGFFVLLSLFARANATAVVDGYQVGGSMWATLRTFLIQQFAPIPGSSLFLRAEFANFMGMGGSPTPAELLAGAWRGAVVAAVVLLVAWRLVRGDQRMPAPRILGYLAVVGGLLWTTSVVVISFSPKYQFELVAGKGHLPTIVQTFGFALVAAAALFALLRAALRRSRAAAACTAVAAAALLGFAAAVDGYNNMRVVALEVPITEARDLLETAAADGALAEMPEGSSLLFSKKDTDWNTGKFSQVPGAFESMLVDRTGRVYDARVPVPEETLGCPAGAGPVPVECAALDSSAAWVRFRGRRGGGSVIVGRVVRPSSRPFADVARDLRVYVRGDGDPPPPPNLIATARDGTRWTSEEVSWRRVSRGDSSAIYDGAVERRPFPVANTLDDAAAQVDFTALAPPEQLVRIYGTKSLLP